jgi:hypothetical protein
MPQTVTTRLGWFQRHFMWALQRYRPPRLIEPLHVYWACPECNLPLVGYPHTACTGGLPHDHS